MVARPHPASKLTLVCTGCRTLIDYLGSAPFGAIEFGGPSSGCQRRSSFPHDMGLGMMLWGCWLQSCHFLPLPCVHLAPFCPLLYLRSMFIIACIFLGCVQTAPLSEQ